MIERQGDLFTTDAKVLAHGVNCKGVMGAGIAKSFRDKFPDMYKEYQYLCNRGILRLGSFYSYTTDDIMIFNLTTQYKPGPDARYGSVFSSLLDSAMSLDDFNKSDGKYGNTIAMPEIGCGIGGLEWGNVEAIIGVVEKIVPGIEFEVWHYE